MCTHQKLGVSIGIARVQAGQTSANLVAIAVQEREAAAIELVLLVRKGLSHIGGLTRTGRGTCCVHAARRCRQLQVVEHDRIPVAARRLCEVGQRGGPPKPSQLTCACTACLACEQNGPALSTAE